VSVREPEPVAADEVPERPAPAGAQPPDPAGAPAIPLARPASTGAHPPDPAGAPPIPLAQPVLGPEEERAVVEVLRSGKLSLGPRVPAFERAFAARLRVPHACAVSSGTAGLHLALRAVGVGDGDEVITSPFSFVASANVALYERARPVFADIDPVTLCLDPDAAAAAVTERTRAVLPVHIFGWPADVPALERLGFPLVEDACEALGAVHPDGTPVGGQGHPAVFGFYANKQLTTGEGGIVTLGDGTLKERIDSERNQGRAPDMGWLDHDRLGFNYRLTDIACALGLAQLERLDGMLAARARVAGWYREALAGVEGSCSWCSSRAGSTATRPCAPSPSAACSPSRTCRRST
jgi:dTDP-4-amino-4,6-dideoxygalactose transaminase